MNHMDMCGISLSLDSSITVYFPAKNAYHTDFKIEANGVTPMPAPIHMIISYLKTSCKE